MSSGSRYGGFGSEDTGYGGYRGEVYGDGGGYGGNPSGFQDTQQRGDKFEEYDEGEEDGGSSAAKPSAASRARASSGLRAASLNTIKRGAKFKKEPEQDLFDFGDEPTTASTSNGKARMASPKAANKYGAMESGAAGDDDFDDFQSATTPGLTTEAQRSAFSGLTSPPPAISTITSSTPFAAPQPVAPPPASNINDLFAKISPTTSSSKPTNSPTPSVSMTSSISSPPAFQATKPGATSFVPTGPNYYTSVQSTINNSTATPSVKSPLSSTISPNQSFPGMGQKQSSFSSTTTAASLGKPNTSTSSSGAGGGDAFGSLWSTVSGKAGIPNKSGGAANKGPDLASMAKAKNEAAMWGAPSPLASGGGTASIPPRPSAPTPRTANQQPQHQQQGTLGGGLDDLLG